MTWFSSTGGVAQSASRMTIRNTIFLILASIALMTISTPANAITCVAFVKQQIASSSPKASYAFSGSITGPDMYSAAKKLNSKSVGSIPSKGAIMVFAKDNTPRSNGIAKLPEGHAALVTKVIDVKTSILVDHANWDKTRNDIKDMSNVTLGAKVLSDDNWSTARVQFNGSMGATKYNVLGFISPALIPTKK